MISYFDPGTNYVLEDEKVLLRPLQADDLQNLLPYAINEPDTWRYSNVSARGEDGMAQYVTAALKARNEGREYAFVVIDKQTGEYAGSTRYYDIQPKLNSLQLGYTWYAEKFRGTGLNKRCKFLLLQFAFEELNMARVEFRADARNERSIAAMKSIGCQVEGILRSNMPLEDGGRRDSIVLSILKEEWENGVKENLKARL
ncbi:GNAT family protein [Mucilaginibacter sp.]|uniref:GNAT family N-acetyltransferase n=1 Tax=Mucilaginibacter sp. TaxID=1882438 RepID=UPI0025EB905D|nr:GNAT family protein [Mucilaginibacter sp.]